MPNYTITPYNQNEIDIILNHIKQCPTNLQEAFKRASSDINRSMSSISGVWYNKLKKQYSTTIIGSEKGIMVNTKNVRRIQEQKSDHFSIIEICITKINKEEKKALINILLNHI